MPNSLTLGFNWILAAKLEFLEAETNITMLLLGTLIVVPKSLLPEAMSIESRPMTLVLVLESLAAMLGTLMPILMSLAAIPRS